MCQPSPAFEAYGVDTYGVYMGICGDGRVEGADFAPGHYQHHIPVDIGQCAAQALHIGVGRGGEEQRIYHDVVPGSQAREFGRYGGKIDGHGRHGRQGLAVLGYGLRQRRAVAHDYDGIATGIFATRPWACAAREQQHLGHALERGPGLCHGVCYLRCRLGHIGEC